MHSHIAPDGQAADATHSWNVPAQLDRQRLDKALATLALISRSQAKAAIEAGHVSLDSATITSPKHAVSCAQLLRAAQLSLAPPGGQPVAPRAMELQFIAEELEFFIVAKPAGLVVHPARGHRDDTLANAIAAYCRRAGELPRAGVVHRLDKDTSGVIVVARTDLARRRLIEQFKERRAQRAYLAIVHGETPATGMIDRAMGRHASHRLKMSVRPGGRPARTRYQRLGVRGGFSYLRCQIESGRTHQIRVHLEYAGHPVAGDRLYRSHARSADIKFPRQMLHAHTLALRHPLTGAQLSYRCPPPSDFVDVARSFGWPPDPA